MIQDKDAPLTWRWKWVHSEGWSSRQRHTHSLHRLNSVRWSRNSNCSNQFWQEIVNGGNAACFPVSLCLCVRAFRWLSDTFTLFMRLGCKRSRTVYLPAALLTGSHHSSTLQTQIFISLHTSVLCVCYSSKLSVFVTGVPKLFQVESQISSWDAGKALFGDVCSICSFFKLSLLSTSMHRTRQGLSSALRWLWWSQLL